jgi:hypothetical protein
MQAIERLKDVRAQLINATAERIVYHVETRDEITRDLARDLLTDDAWFERGGSDWDACVTVLQVAWQDDQEDLDAAINVVMKRAQRLWDRLA